MMQDLYHEPHLSTKQGAEVRLHSAQWRRLGHGPDGAPRARAVRHVLRGLRFMAKKPELHPIYVDVYIYIYIRVYIYLFM